MRRAAIALACSLLACDDGAIRLSSGVEAPDATTFGEDAATLDDDATSGTKDGGGQPGSDATSPPPPTEASAPDAGAHGCLVDTDCPLASLHCDVPSGTCVQCTNDSQCTKPGFPRCDLASHLCVACGVNADCADGGVCDPATLHCAIPCGDGGKCAGDDQTCNSHGYCASCDSTKDAGACSSGSANVCDDGTGQCCECTKDSQCPASKPHCHVGSDSCVQCVASSQCPAAAPVCDPSTWTCVP